MGLDVDIVSGVPGVYREVAARSPGFPRLRTDVVGFAGIAGAAHLGEVVRVDDWRSYQRIFLRDDRGRAIEPPAGSTLWSCVKAYFANGGARCWVANVAGAVDASDPHRLVDLLLGASARTGVEALLAVPEVAIVAVPDFDAQIVEVEPETIPVVQEGRFVCCPGLHVVGATLEVDQRPVRRVLDDATLLEAQRALIERCERDRWRVFAVLGPPPGQSPPQVTRWKDQLVAPVGGADCAALYWPWVVAQDVPGGATELRSPVGYVCGVFARRDLARGPDAAPANEPLVGVVATEWKLDDEAHGAVYADGVNVLRSFSGRGVDLWGARTLLYPSPEGDPLAYVNVRRCLSAIERTCALIGSTTTFEPNQPLVRFRLAQGIVGYLLDVYARGSLLGVTAEEAFFVRCDESNNPRASVEQGELYCDVGVAIAEPAEFLVFRVGRLEGVVDLQEVT